MYNSFLISEVFIKTFFYSVKFEIEKESVIMLNFIASINELFWGTILILLLVGTGIFYTFKLKFYNLSSEVTSSKIIGIVTTSPLKLVCFRFSLI